MAGLGGCGFFPNFMSFYLVLLFLMFLVFFQVVRSVIIIRVKCMLVLVSKVWAISCPFKNNFPYSSLGVLSFSSFEVSSSRRIAMASAVCLREAICMLAFSSRLSYDQRVRYLRCRRFFSVDGRLRRLVFSFNFLRSFRKSVSTPCYCDSAARMDRRLLDVRCADGVGSNECGHYPDLLYPTISSLVYRNVVILSLNNAFVILNCSYVVLDLVVRTLVLFSRIAYPVSLEAL